MEKVVRKINYEINPVIFFNRGCIKKAKREMKKLLKPEEKKYSNWLV